MNTFDKLHIGIEITVSYSEWLNMKYLVEEYGVAGTIQYQIESGNIRCLDEVIKDLHICQYIVRGDRFPDHDYLRIFVPHLYHQL